jgi:hypothetical protein
MSILQTKPLTDTWVAASWEDYIDTLENSQCEQAKGYYYKGHMRIERLPVSFDHGQDHVVIISAVNLFTILRDFHANKQSVHPVSTALNLRVSRVERSRNPVKWDDFLFVSP